MNSQEYQKNYGEQHKEGMRELQKRWREKHPNYFKEWLKNNNLLEKKQCDKCGRLLSVRYIEQHGCKKNK